MRTRVLARLLSVPVVVVVVLLGVWIAGGLLTNDFQLAMVLTIAWLGLAGLICLAIALRSRALRSPVLSAYVLTAALAGAYLGANTLLDRTVNEQVAMAAPAPPPVSSGDDATATATRPAMARNVRLAAGRFLPVRHAARGTATAIRLARGGRVLTLTGFEVDNGPDLRVYLVPGPATTEGAVRDVVDLGGLKGNKGDQQYVLPAGVRLRRHDTVVIWCRAFSVLFARAPLR